WRTRRSCKCATLASVTQSAWPSWPAASSRPWSGRRSSTAPRRSSSSRRRSNASASTPRPRRRTAARRARVIIRKLCVSA
ncbi:hypothetical protein M885DRAFT_619894, partial [Pelagophyceae sp. CCMP2097]